MKARKIINYSSCRRRQEKKFASEKKGRKPKRVIELCSTKCNERD